MPEVLPSISIHVTKYRDRNIRWKFSDSPGNRTYIVPRPLSSTSFVFFTQCQTTTFFKSLLTRHGTDRVEEYLKTEREGNSKWREKYCDTDF